MASAVAYLDDKDPPFLQGWAIVENTTESDWNDVGLTLVLGATAVIAALDHRRRTGSGAVVRTRNRGEGAAGRGPRRALIQRACRPSG